MGVGARGILKALTSSQENSQKAGLGPAGEQRQGLPGRHQFHVSWMSALPWSGFLPSAGTELITQRNELRADLS